jgi:hypothetical protein
MATKKTSSRKASATVRYIDRRAVGSRPGTFADPRKMMENYGGYEFDKNGKMISGFYDPDNYAKAMDDYRAGRTRARQEGVARRSVKKASVANAAKRKISAKKKAAVKYGTPMKNVSAKRRPKPRAAQNKR